MYKKVKSFLKGYLVISLKGNALERLINQLNEANITLYDLKRVKKNYYIAKINIVDFKKIRNVVRNRLCEVSILEKKGLIFKIKFLLNNKSILISILLFLLLLWTLSQFLFLVEITGETDINKNNIVEYLKKNDIKRGRLKKNINLSQLEKNMISKFDDFNWVYIYWSGSKLIIEVDNKEKITNEISSEIYAKKSGKITKLIVLKGIPLVEEGDYVTKGEKLVISQNNNESAKAIIEGEVWYKSIVKSNLNRIFIDKDKYTKRYGIMINDKKLYFNKIKEENTSYLKQSIIKRIFEWRNNRFTIEIINEKLYKINRKNIFIAKNYLMFLAKEEALINILKKLNDNCVIKDIIIKEEFIDENKSLLKKTILIRSMESLIE
ncbi:MAG: sporulation protein YqfD [Bacillota bacterium]